MLNVMGYSKVYYSTDAVIEHPGRNPVFTGENTAGFANNADDVSDTNTPDLNSRELLNRFDVIKGLYDSESTPAGKIRLRKEAHCIKQLIGDHRRKVFYSTGSVLLAIALLIVLLQNMGLI